MTRKLVRLSPKGKQDQIQICIPKKVAEEMKLKPGDYVMVESNGAKITVSPVTISERG